jgi:hypothetical protein
MGCRRRLWCHSSRLGASSTCRPMRLRQHRCMRGGPRSQRHHIPMTGLQYLNGRQCAPSGNTPRQVQPNERKTRTGTIYNFSASYAHALLAGPAAAPPRLRRQAGDAARCARGGAPVPQPPRGRRPTAAAGPAAAAAVARPRTRHRGACRPAKEVIVREGGRGRETKQAPTRPLRPWLRPPSRPSAARTSARAGRGACAAPPL